jgi:hypothetical protein
MAKAAKQVDAEFTPKLINGIIKDINEADEQIDSARGKYMNAARRQRELKQAVYERAASQGIPQKVMKLQVEAERLLEKYLGKVAELEVENRKMALKIAKVRGNKAQMALFNDLPPMPKEPKTKATKAKPEQADLEDALPPPDESNVHQLGAA